VWYAIAASRAARAFCSHGSTATLHSARLAGYTEASRMPLASAKTLMEATVLSLLAPSRGAAAW